jgi:hypothetical protein
MKASHLYDFMWDKYEYLLNNPTKIERSLWWLPQAYTLKNNSVDTPREGSVKFCTPFVIKILNRDSLSCVKCPWFRFCSGCILDPLKNDYIEIKPTHIIMIEWCSDLVKKEINENNLNLILNYSEDDNSQANNGENEPTSVRRKNEKMKTTNISLDDCFSLFTEMEDLGDDQLYCSKCKTSTNFFKKYDFERTPSYLIIALKRFKFTKMYKRKIDCLIDYPIYDLDMSNYLVNYSANNIGSALYDLYGVINHMGSLGSGHYTSVMKQGAKWIKYDDAHAQEIDESLIKTSNSYILIYKLKDEAAPQNDYYNLLTEIYFNDYNERGKLMSNNSTLVSTLKKSDTTIQLMFKNFYIGEPVITKYGYATVLDTYFIEGVQFAKVKFKFGYGFIK